MVEDFDLTKLLHMDEKFYKERIWPRMFYTSPKDLWRWKMNVARVMGNSLDNKYVPELIKAFENNTDERVLGIIAWALGQIGGSIAQNFLEGVLESSQGLIKQEILSAMNHVKSIFDPNNVLSPGNLCFEEVPK